MQFILAEQSLANITEKQVQCKRNAKNSNFRPLQQNNTNDYYKRRANKQFAQIKPTVQI